MVPIGTQLLVVLSLVCMNGGLVLAKAAAISASRARLTAEVEAGGRLARSAVRLLSNTRAPLLTARIVIVIGVCLAGVYCGAHLVPTLARSMKAVPYLTDLSEPASFWLIVFLLSATYILIGELIPRRLGQAYPEEFLKLTAPILLAITTAATPFVALFEGFTSMVFTVLPFRSTPKEVTEEVLKHLLEQGTGVLKRSESRILAKVFRLSDKPAAALMTPRNDVVWLDIEEPVSTLWEEVRNCHYSYFPVCRGTIDHVEGIASVRDIASCLLSGEKYLRREDLREVLQLPTTTAALAVLERFKKEKRHLAVIIDEYGGVDGLVTTHDLMEALVGELQDESEGDASRIVRRADGSYLADASVDLDELLDHLSIPGGIEQWGRERGGYHSLGGLVMGQLGHVPQEAESFVFMGFRFEVVDMDGYRIDKVLVSPVSTQE